MILREEDIDTVGGAVYYERKTYLSFVICAVLLVDSVQFYSLFAQFYSLIEALFKFFFSYY